MKSIRENTAVQYDDQDAEELFEKAVYGDNEMSDHTYLQMSNGSIKEIDPVDETMNMISNHRSFRPNSFADRTFHEAHEFTPE